MSYTIERFGDHVWNSLFFCMGEERYSYPYLEEFIFLSWKEGRKRYNLTLFYALPSVDPRHSMRLDVFFNVLIYTCFHSFFLIGFRGD